MWAAERVQDNKPFGRQELNFKKIIKLASMQIIMGQHRYHTVDNDGITCPSDAG
jgi:hypothetical protein